MDTATNITIRLATKTDFSEVWEMSEAIYAGLDSFPRNFLNILDECQQTVLMAMKNGKGVGLRSIRVIDNGETALFESLRVHSSYRGQGIAKELLKASEEYVKLHFPRIKTIRYSMTTRDKSRLALQSKSDDRLFLKLALCACFVEPIQTASALKKHATTATDTRSASVKELTIGDINFYLKQNKMDRVLYNKCFFATYTLFRATTSNIDSGLINEKHNFFASSSGEGVESFSQSNRTVCVKCPRWCVTLYDMDENLIEIHIVKHLQRAILQDSKETFAFVCFFDVSLITRISKFLFRELALKNIDGYCREGHHLFVSVFEKDLSK